jgi:hypothetical protein
MKLKAIYEVKNGAEFEKVVTLDRVYPLVWRKAGVGPRPIPSPVEISGYSHFFGLERTFER